MRRALPGALAGCLIAALATTIAAPLAFAGAAPGAVAAASTAGPPPAARAAPARAVPATEPVLVVLGDSLSAGYGIRVEEGWVALLQKRLQAEGYGYRVVNASVSGETTGGALARLPRVLKVHRPAVVIVELGGNDGLRGLPVEELRANLDRLVALAKAAGARVVLTGMRIPSNYGAQYTERFYASYGEIARRHSVALVPFLLERVARDDALFQADGIHPVAKAQPLLLDTVWPVLSTVLTRAGAKPVS